MATPRTHQTQKQIALEAAESLLLPRGMGQWPPRTFSYRVSVAACAAPDGGQWAHEWLFHTCVFVQRTLPYQPGPIHPGKHGSTRLPCTSIHQRSRQRHGSPTNIHPQYLHYHSDHTTKQHLRTTAPSRLHATPGAFSHRPTRASPPVLG